MSQEIKIGVLGAANIAKTRMIPTILKTEGAKYAGVAVANAEEYGGAADTYASVARANDAKAQEFKEAFGGEVFGSFREMLNREDIDMIYLPLPPSLHYKWGMEVLKAGKHLLMEKPFTLEKEKTEELLKLAEEKGLSVIENYGFPLHAQFEKIRELLDSGAIGDLRLVRTAFGFPHRQAEDFRYSKAYGGGALFDCGGYCLKMATQFLKEPVQLLAPSLTVTEGHEVDINGSATLTDGDVTVQIAFGMDHAYKCELELWGSTGTLTAPRIYTAPADFTPVLTIKSNAGEEKIEARPCNQFGKVLEKILDAVGDPAKSEEIRKEIRLQADLLTQFAAQCLS